MCHCTERQSCHADILISAYREQFPSAYDRDDPNSIPPSSEHLNYLARLREEVDSDDGSTADEGASSKGSGWTGVGRAMQVGVGYTVRELCDGQSLASPGRWPVEARRYPDSEEWRAVVTPFRQFAEHHCPPSLLVDLALGRVAKSPFPEGDVRELKQRIITSLEGKGLQLGRVQGDRNELPIDFRFLDLLLRASADPEVHLGAFAQGVKVGPGTRMPRLPALYRPKRRWRLESQRDPQAYLEEEEHSAKPWRQNYTSLTEFADKVEAVLEDQSARGQVLKYSEEAARDRYPDLVVASLGAQRKDKPNGEVSARVLFDGTHGLAVNTRTRIRDQERSPIAADLKRAMREKAQLQQPTFALTADVKEAHRQVPVHPSDWRFLGCQVKKGGTVYRVLHRIGTFSLGCVTTKVPIATHPPCASQ